MGDSYTIGTGASDASLAWPSIIAAKLESATGTPVELTNPAVNGYTTDDLIEHELPLIERNKPDLVTVLIGVNDLVRGRSAEHYRAKLGQIYDAIAALSLPAGRVAGISIPTWSYVPAARDYGGAERVDALTRLLNETAREEAAARRFTWVDIGPASLSGVGTNGWVAGDDLHPGDAQYAAWAEAIWPAVKAAF
ncbi:MAG TPA: SGNH/GDSL hydrolase family protein [Candidatus Dormibacteraeota bacterium]